MRLKLDLLCLVILDLKFRKEMQESFVYIFLYAVYLPFNSNIKLINPELLFITKDTIKVSINSGSNCREVSAGS